MGRSEAAQAEGCHNDSGASVMVCGEAVMDLVPGPDSQGRNGATYRALPGGSPANTAVALARLGVPTYFCGRLSSDALGDRLYSHLEANGVRMRFVLRRPEPSTLAMVDLQRDGSANYSLYVQGTSDFQWTSQELPNDLPAEISVLHVGSLALALAPGSAAIEALMAAAAKKRVVSLDPNVRPALIGDLSRFRANLERWVDMAHLVKVSLDDLEALYWDQDPLQIARRWADRVPLVVVTLGDKGALALHLGQEIGVPANPTPVADTVGAGDTFSAALIEGLVAHASPLSPGLEGLGPEVVAQAMEGAARAAAITCSRPGADPPWRAELLPGAGR